MRLAALAKSRREIRGVIDFLINEVRRLGVEIRLGQEVRGTEPELALFDAVVVCTGSTAEIAGSDPVSPAVLGIPGMEEADAWTGRQVMEHPEVVGAKVLVVDYESHVQGLAVSEHLLDHGKQVHLVTSDSVPGSKVGGMAWVRLRQDAAAKGLRVWSTSTLAGLEHGRALVQDLLTGNVQAIDIDSVVIVGASIARDSVLISLGQERIDVLAAGDCVAPRHLDMAILEGARVGRMV